MKKNKKWTAEEDAELVALLSENKDNFQKAFREFHIRHRSRSIQATAQRWYGVLRLRNDVNVCLMTMGNKPKKEKPSFLKRMLKIFKL